MIKGADERGAVLREVLYPVVVVAIISAVAMAALHIDAVAPLRQMVPALEGARQRMGDLVSGHAQPHPRAG